MKAEMFDKIVKARADQLVDRKIKDFRGAIYQALRNIMGCDNRELFSYGGGNLNDEAKSLIKIAAMDYSDQKWPRSLWGRETKEVTAALLQTFDEFTQARLAADKAGPPENKMEEEKKPETTGDLDDDDEGPF